MDKPLTNKINALTTYANEVTEENDTNLSDAVYTLTEGFGQGGVSVGNVRYTRYELTEDTTIESLLNSIDYRPIDTSNFTIFIRVSGTAAPATGSYTLNNFFVRTTDAGALRGGYAYKNGKVTPNSFNDLYIGMTELNNKFAITDGILRYTGSTTSCLGTTGDIVTIAELHGNMHISMTTMCGGTIPTPKAIFQGIEIKTNDSGQITDYIFHGYDEIPPYILNYIGYNRSANTGPIPVISFADKPTKIDGYAFYQARASIDYAGLSEVEKIGGEYALSIACSSFNDRTADVVLLPKFRGYVDSTYNAISLFRSDFVYVPKTYILPVCEIIPQFAWYASRLTDLSITIGSIGHAVTGCRERPFGSTTNASGTVTIYTNGSHLSTVKTAVENSAGTNLTFIYKASEPTTYNDVSYAAGDTIAV